MAGAKYVTNGHAGPPSPLETEIPAALHDAAQTRRPLATHPAKCRGGKKRGGRHVAANRESHTPNPGIQNPPPVQDQHGAQARDRIFGYRCCPKLWRIRPPAPRGINSSAVRAIRPKLWRISRIQNGRVFALRLHFDSTGGGGQNTQNAP